MGENVFSFLSPAKLRSLTPALSQREREADTVLYIKDSGRLEGDGISELRAKG